MKELQPVSDKVLMNLKTLETGLTAVKERVAQRDFYRSTEYKDPDVAFSHPANGLVVTKLDDKLITAMKGGILGAFRELVSEGFGDIAAQKLKENK